MQAALTGHLCPAIPEVRKGLEHLFVAFTNRIELLANTQRRIEDFRVGGLRVGRQLAFSASRVANSLAGAIKCNAPFPVGGDELLGKRVSTVIHGVVLIIFSDHEHDPAPLASRECVAIMATLQNGLDAARSYTCR